MDKIKSYKDLLVWQKSMDFCEFVYLSSHSFPSSEKFGLTNQIRRAVVSIPSNIAEGFGRKSNGDYSRFLKFSYGSTLELLTQWEIAKRIKYLEEEAYSKGVEKAQEIERMLASLIRKVEDAR